MCQSYTWSSRKKTVPYNCSCPGPPVCLLTGGQEASAGQGDSATHIHIPHDLGSCEQVNHFPTPKKELFETVKNQASHHNNRARHPRCS